MAQSFLVKHAIRPVRLERCAARQLTSFPSPIACPLQVQIAALRQYEAAAQHCTSAEICFLTVFQIMQARSMPQQAEFDKRVTSMLDERDEAGGC